MSKLSERRREISAMGMAEAQNELKTLRRKLFELRLQLARGEVKNNRQFPQVKADIARLMYRMSEINRRGPQAEPESEPEPEPAAPPPVEAEAVPAAKRTRRAKAAPADAAPEAKRETKRETKSSAK